MRSNQNFPLVTSAVVGAAIVASVVPALQRALVFDRAAIGAGQSWRLLTGHCVHFSPDHLFYDTVALGAAGWTIERRRRGELALLCGISALAVGMAVYTLAPQVTRYGGLSGVACAAVAALAVRGLRSSGTPRWVCAAALLALIGKVTWECLTGGALFVSARPDVVVLPLAHGIGMAAGGVFAIVATGSSAVFSSRADRSMGTSTPLAGGYRRSDSPASCEVQT